MDARKIRRAAFTVAGVIGVGLALVALFLLSWTPENSEDYESLHIVILLINKRARVGEQSAEQVRTKPAHCERCRST